MKMSLFIWILLFIAANCDSSNIRIKQNVTKREVDGNFYPNWVPFKNKHGEELGEFIDVNKPKPKKRLALPVNFVLKAVASESDDYYDKSQGDGEDYYEKKEWSDLNRPAQSVDVKIHPSNISDIDGIVNIITKPSNSPILKALSGRKKTSRQQVKEKSKRQSIDKDLKVKKLEEVHENVESQSQNDVRNEEKNEGEVKDEEFINDNKKENIEESDEDIEDESKEKVEKHNSNKKEETIDKEKEYSDDEEESTEKQKEEEAKAEEQRQNEERKAKILSSVDELKERHAKEQQRISEKAKEEEMLKDELDRELKRSGNNKHDNYDKYTHSNSKWKKLTDDIDSSDEDEESVFKNKYEIHPYKSTITSTITTTTTLPPKKQTTQKRRKEKTVATAKLSVFRNPNLYTIHDEEYDTTTVKPKKPKIQKPRKFSSRYSAADEDNVRISLVPADDSKEGEPTLFYPKKRKNMRKSKTTTPTPDTTADSSQETSSLTETRISSDLSGISPSAPEPTGTGPSDTFISASHTAPSDDIAPDTTASDSSDSTQASSSKKEEANDGDYHREKGGGKETSEEHEEVYEEHGKKAYEGVHNDTKTNKGHHDKEDVLDKYDDHGAIDKQHHKEDNLYGSHHHEEHGKKHAKYEESGKHSKGHSTKGSHDIHKKDEYEKKVEFFEEEGDSDDEEHDGGYHKEKEHTSGGHFKKGSLEATHAGHWKGDTGHFAKGGHGNHHKGHKASEGKDSHGRHSGGHHKFDGHSGGKRWVYHHGYPAKNANLIIIDRRADAYQHGPLYYG